LSQSPKVTDFERRLRLMLQQLFGALPRLNLEHALLSSDRFT